MAWFGYDQGVFSGVLISSDFKKWFPETNDADISGITSSSFAVRLSQPSAPFPQKKYLPSGLRS